MIRHCDGNDPNLVKPDPDDPQRYIPCDCGLTFDDVEHRVIYPHEQIVKLTAEQRDNLLRNLDT